MRAISQRRFVLHACLGRGGFGEVFRATMINPGGLRTEVAVKLLHGGVTPDADSVRRLRDEGKLLAALSHPAILKVHDLATLDGRVALVTEYVEGEDLTGCLAAEPRIPLRAMVEVIGQVAGALHAAYHTTPSEGSRPLCLVHRDIKPSNIRIGRHGEVKILDFGIAWADHDRRESETRTNSTFGSVAYMAPERFSKRSPIGPASDVYALGCVLFDGLVGVRLQENSEPVELMRLAGDPAAHAAFLAERLAHLAPTCPNALQLLLRAMLAFAPEDRPTAVDVERRCERLDDPLTGDRLRTWCRNRHWPEEATSSLLDGRIVDEGTPTTGSVPTPAGPTPRDDTFEFDPRAAVPTLGRKPNRRGLLVAAAIALGSAAGLVGLRNLPSVELSPSPVETPARPADAPPSPVPDPPVPDPPSTPLAPLLQALPAAPPRAPSSPTTALRKSSVSPTMDRDQHVEVAQPQVEDRVEPGEVRLRTGVTAGLVVELRAGGRSFPPGAVPEGTYDIWADFGAGLSDAGVVAVRSGRPVEIECNRLKFSCTSTP